MSQSTLTADPKRSKSSEPPATEAFLEVRVEDLIVGRPLKFPVKDMTGLLLLAANSMITADFKRLLQQRKVTSIRVNQADAASISLTPEQVAERTSIEEMNSTVAAQLDKVIDSGLLTFQNNGPAFRQKIVAHGRKTYQPEKQRMLRDMRTATSESLNAMINSALQGKSVSSSVVNTAATGFLSGISEDSDCALFAAMEAVQDATIADHCFKTSMLATAIAVEMGMNEINCRCVCMAGLVHDWGMAKVPETLRHASRVLTEIEFYEIKKHPIHTLEMLERMPGVPSIVPIIAYQVHERPNGKGYPRGKTNERIHILARILAVADMFTALTEDKPYRRPLTPHAAIECLVRLARTRDVDPDVIRALLKSLCLFPIGSYVALSDGSLAQVIRRNGDDYGKPFLQRILRVDGSQTVQHDAALIDLNDSNLSVVQALPTPNRNQIPLSDDILFPTRSKA